MAYPIENSDIQDTLLGFIAPWRDQVDTVRKFQHPTYTCVRLIIGDRDIFISAERVDKRIYVGSSLRANDEDDDSWLENAGYYGRKLFTLEQYILEQFPVALDRDKLFKIFRKGIRTDRAAQVQQYLDINRHLIGAFIQYAINLATNT